MKTIDQTREVGAIIGRFQVPNLHEAHKTLIQGVLDTHPRVFLFLGLSPCKCTYNNPLDFATRKAMIEKEFPTVEIFYIEDMMDDRAWSSELDKQINRHLGPNQKILLYGSRDSFIPHYCGKHPTMDLASNTIVSGREIRKNVGIKSKNDPAFREGVIWAVENQWASIMPTVDIAVLDTNQKRTLLARKPNEVAYRFVGGFANADSVSYEEDAKRELMEETGLECSDFSYLGSVKIDDWRYRSEQNKIKTLFFMCSYVFGNPKANDDIAEVKWVSFDRLMEEDAESFFVETHRPLFRILKKKLETLIKPTVKA